MTFSALADMSRRIPDGGRSAPRQSAVTGFGIHHNAGVDAYGEATNPRREVSANYWIANDGTILPNIDETRRAFTSGAVGYPAGALADHRNVTVEVSNSPEGVRSGTWAISEAAMASLVALIADVWIRYDLSLVERSATRGLGVHQDWVPTSCPGPYIMANLGEIIAAANRIVTGEASPIQTQEEEDDMNIYLEATDDSTPIKDPDGVMRSRIWHGERKIGGMTFANVWERSADGTARRLFKAEWEGIVEAYGLVGRTVPLVKMNGNSIEQVMYGKRY